VNDGAHVIVLCSLELSAVVLVEGGEKYTFDGLRGEEVVDHELDALDWLCVLNRIWRILYNDAARQIGVLSLQSSALVADTTTDINEMGTLGLERSRQFSERRDIKPVAFPGYAHHGLKPSKLLGILRYEGKEIKRCSKGLVPCKLGTSVVLILGILKIIGYDLSNWPGEVMTTSLST
jgi:hypothetical protein